jgi:thiol:disulfide interchange protein DsbA
MYTRFCLVLLLSLTAPFAFSEAASPLAERFVADEHYEVIEIPVGTRDESKVEVVEMFSYACVHCFNFDPYVKAWQTKQTDGVDFHLIPAIFNPDWELLAQAYYTADALGAVDAVHERMFEGIHTKNEDLRQPDLLAPLFVELAGVSEDDFNSAYGSFSVRSRVEQAKAKVRAYRITGVPTIIVNGKYRVDGRMAGGNAAMLEVVDFLVTKERSGQTP